MKISIYSTFGILLSLVIKVNAQDTLKMQKKIDSLFYTANEHYMVQDYDTCLKLRARAMKIIKKLEKWEDAVNEYNIISVVGSEMEDTDLIFLSLDSALAISEKYLDQDNLAYITTIANLGYYEWEGSNYNEAIRLLEKAMTMYRNASAPPDEYIYSLRNLILTYRQKGDLDNSNKIIDVYLPILDTMGIKHLGKTTHLMYSKAANLNEDLNFNEAEEILNHASLRNQSVKDKYERISNKVHIQIFLARALNGQGKKSEAIAALDSLSNNDLELSGIALQVYFDKAKIQLENGQIEDAIKSFRKSYDINVSRNDIKTKELANYASGLGKAYLKNNQLDSAEFYIKEALLLSDMDSQNMFRNYGEYLNVQNFNINNVRMLSNLADLHIEKYRLTRNTNFKSASLNAYRKAFKGSKYLMKELQSKSSKYQLNRILQDHFSAYLSLLKEDYQNSKSEQTFEEIFKLIEDNKSIVLRENVQVRDAIATSNLPPELLEKEATFKSEINDLKRKIYELSSNKILDEEKTSLLKDELLQQKLDYEKFRLELESDFPNYFNAKYAIHDVDIKEIQSRLDSDEAMVNFYISNNNYLCAWLTKSAYGIHFINEPNKTSSKVSHLLKLIRKAPQSLSIDLLNSYKELSNGIYIDLIPPDIHKKSHLVVSPMGSLHYLPFGILLTDESVDSESFKNLPYLIKTKEIEYAFSADLWLESKNSEKRKLESIFAFAPFTGTDGSEERVCSAQDDTQLQLLHCSEDEVSFESEDHIAYLAEKATIVHFKSLPATHIIHLATHACLDDEDPSFNKVLFHDDYLAIQDLESMELNAQLAILSACNTGTGKIRSGEGVINLGKGFRSAGVHSLISSLWSINDCATSEIIQNFYPNIQKNNLSASLQKAKLEYLQNADQVHAHPYYWGGLTFTGNTNAFYQKSNYKGYVLLALALCLILILFLRKK